MGKNLVFSLVAILALVAIFVSLQTRTGGRADGRVKDAILGDFEKMTALYELSDELDTTQPTSEEEIEAWVERAQNLGPKIEALGEDARRLRTETLSYINGLDPSLRQPLDQATLEYFEAENAYYKMVTAPVNQSSVTLYNRESISDEERRELEKLAETGRNLEACFLTLLDRQQALISVAREQGLAVAPDWSEAKQQEILESYRSLSRMGEKEPASDR